MTFTTEQQNLLAADKRGRVRVSDERREVLLDEFERSGMSAVRFAERIGVKYSTFAQWVQRRRKARQEEAAVKPGPVTFLEAVMDPPVENRAPAHGLTVMLPGGAHVVVETVVQLRLAAELLGMLASSGGQGC
jgi:transposase-like protein